MPPQAVSANGQGYSNLPPAAMQEEEEYHPF
jgi:hypothetical protein